MTEQYAETKPRLPNQTGLCVLSFLIPIVGLIMALLYKSKEDIAAQNTGNAMLMWSLIAFGMWVILIPVVFGIGLVGWYFMNPPSPSHHSIILLQGLLTAGC